ncbi:MAG: TRAP transporter substrate-binding protein [Desulfobacterota bacterium]|nr:TRAP transporter substrate-binding protein [Thermodesulfobacteriota bacterium]
MRKRQVLGVLCFFLAIAFLPCEPLFAKDEVIELKFANYFPPPARQSKFCEEFIADLEKRTNGKIKVQYFTGSSLLKAPNMFKGISSGIADIGLSHVEYSPGRMPVTEACDLPLGYPSGWVACNVTNDFYEKFKPKEWDEVQVLWMHASTPNVIISRKPVRKLEDMKGLTIRAPGRIGDTMKALGATPAPTPLMETYDAISKGVVDGVNTPFETLKSFKFAEVAKYTTASWQVGNLYAFYVVMNKQTYGKLTGDLKKTFDQLCKEYKDKTALMWNETDFEGKEFALSKGVEIIELSPEEIQKWKAAAAPAIEEYVKSMVSLGFAEKEIRGWIQFLRERIDYWTAKQIELKIKSVTGPDAIRK